MKEQKLEHVVGNLGVYRVEAPFDEALKSLSSANCRPISSRELAYVRVKQKDRNCSIWNFGNYTREGFLYSKNKPVLVALNSPLLDLQLAQLAVESNRRAKYFSVDNEVYERYREIAEDDKNKPTEEIAVLILPKRENYGIPTNRFNENELALFLFKDQAENYGNYLKKEGISAIPIMLIDKNYVDSNEKTFLTQLWISYLENWSVLDGSNRLLHLDEGDYKRDVRMRSVKIVK